MDHSESEPPDHVLVERLQNSDNEEAAKALAELYRRHFEFMYGCLARQRIELNRDFGVEPEDVIADTFLKVYSTKAKTFKRGNYKTPQDSHRHVYKWLSQVAFNLLIDNKKKKKVVRARLYAEIEVASSAESQPDDLGENSDIFELIAIKLNPRDQEILWLSMQYFDVVKRKSNPPEEDVDELCMRWGITRQNMRKRFERIKRTLAESLYKIYK